MQAKPFKLLCNINMLFLRWVEIEIDDYAQKSLIIQWLW
jgi:hypothetical protein